MAKWKLENLNEKIWNFFASVDLAVALFIVISLAAAIGTVIPQQLEPEATIRFFSKFFSMDTSLKIHEIVSLLDLNNVYHSWWFTFLLFMFALNLVVCSIDRLPKLLKSYRTLPQALSLKVLESMPLKKQLILSDISHLKEKLSEILKRKGFSVNVFDTPEGIQLQAKKWSKTRLAVYLTHFSIIVILTGALLGTFFGFRGHMNILEGTALDFIISDEGKTIPLDFQILCEKFEVEYYENSAVPKAFRSYLKILQKDKPVMINGKDTVILEVNEPFSYGGLTFYQASYGFQPTEHAEFRFTFLHEQDRKIPIRVKFEEKVRIPNSAVLFSVIDFSPALGIDEEGRLFNMTTDMINPAVLVEFDNQGKKTQQWILKKIPQTWDTPYGKLRFDELWGAQFTGLQVRKDPGVPFIYFGSILLCLGLFVSLFLRPINYFVIIDKNKVTFYSPTLKGKVTIEKQLEEIIKKLKGEGK